MRFQLYGFFLTLVLGQFCWAAGPHNYAPNDSEVTEPQIENSEVLDIEKSNLSLTPVKLRPRPQSTKNYYYPYKQSISPHLDIGFDNNHYKEQSSFIYGFGFNYMIPANRSPQWEVGASLTDQSVGEFDFMRRWIVNERGSMRPYYKLGGAIRMMPDEQLGSLTTINNYLIKASAGAEYLVRAPISFRGEVELVTGVKNFLATVKLGYSWAW